MVVMATKVPKMEGREKAALLKNCHGNLDCEAGLEDKNHTLATYKEVPRTPQDSLHFRELSAMNQVLLVPQLISQIS